ncbi:dehydrogenase/reductase (SDR family) member 7Cb [Myripristis murdjan]|uniref:dehydrogenase/reductase (SDR family) member 7Cb n=1 Tax=Myripristis murdjan TaxID=586833 RepID=UPI001175CD17|nr:dehydrogenase/reductase SDR family member 7C-A-like [Myripristis murdjan]
MALPSVMVLPLLIVIAAGIYYIYTEVIHFMSKSLVRNKVVVITDAVSGVGRECAQLFHKGGARLVLCGTSWDKLESLYDSLTSDADPRETFAPKLVILDFSDMDSIEEVVAEVGDCYGCVDVLICNSSMKLKAPVQSVSLELDRNIMDINYFGPSTLAKGVLPMMISRRSGHIVLVNSIQGRLAVPFRSSYAASKHAAQAFFDCLRAEVEEYGILVSTISHTFINASATMPSAPTPPAPTPSDQSPSEQPPTEQPPTEQPTSKAPASQSLVNQLAPLLNKLAAYIASQLTHGVRPSVLANEIMRTVNRKRKEVLLAHPIPRVALYLRSLFPSFLFAVVAAGVKDSALADQMQ